MFVDSDDYLAPRAIQSFLYYAGNKQVIISMILFKAESIGLMLKEGCVDK